MQGNFIMLQKDDLKQVVSELVEELIGKKSQTDLTPEESDEYYTRDQVCERLHITYTTLWRMQKEGTIIVHKLGGRNLYSRRFDTNYRTAQSAVGKCGRQNDRLHSRQMGSTVSLKGTDGSGQCLPPFRPCGR